MEKPRAAGSEGIFPPALASLTCSLAGLGTLWGAWHKGGNGEPP